jgi:hypothetical protein
MRVFVISLVCISIYFALRRKVYIPIQLYSIVSWILVLISSGGANAYSRFRVPLIPLEIIIICIGLSNAKTEERFRAQYFDLHGRRRNLRAKKNKEIAEKSKDAPNK